MKNLTKRLQLWSFLFVGSGMFMLTSCGNGELTKGKAEDALEDGLLIFQDNSQVESIPVGYFQIDDEKARGLLKELADAGMITYKVEKVVEDKKQANYSYYGGRTYSTKEVDHYFATVALTPEGEKQIIKEPLLALEDKDMENKQKDKEIKKTTTSYTTADSIRIADSIAAVEAANAEMATAETIEAPQEVQEKSAYKMAQEKQSYGTEYVLSHKNKIVKIKDIYCPEELLKMGKANCDYIYENVKVTPFGRILGRVTEGERHKNSASFIFYIDRGWCVDK